MKRTSLALILILALLISTVAGAKLVNWAYAYIPHHLSLSNSPDPNPPLISVLSPMQNSTYNSTILWLTFNVSKPETWFVHDVVYDSYGCHGQIEWVGYNLDGKESEKFSVHDYSWGDYPAPPPRTPLDFSFNLTGLSEGRHTLIVSAEGVYAYATEKGSNSFPYPYPNSNYYSYQAITFNTVIGNSTEIEFIVNTAPPEISLLLPENKTYNATDVPLNFSVNEAVSWMAYSLDEGDNITIAGNTTLTSLLYGSHTLTIYANDTAGTFGVPRTSYFSVVNESEPEPFPTTLAAVAIMTVTVSSVSLLVYFKKRNKVNADLAADVFTNSG
jgi:hypothetical protein